MGALATDFALASFSFQQINNTKKGFPPITASPETTLGRPAFLRGFKHMYFHKIALQETIVCTENLCCTHTRSES